jgi:hypothetical protein
MFTVAYLRDRAIRVRDLARRTGNFEDARYLRELTTDAYGQVEAHDEQAAPSEDLDLREGRPRPRRLD